MSALSILITLVLIAALVAVLIALDAFIDWRARTNAKRQQDADAEECCCTADCPPEEAR